MENIIITIRDRNKNFSKDMEIPTTVPMKLVTEKIIANLALLYPSYPFYDTRWTLLCERTDRRVSMENTAEECGIWNGDYLILTEV